LRRQTLGFARPSTLACGGRAPWSRASLSFNPWVVAPSPQFWVVRSPFLLGVDLIGFVLSSGRMIGDGGLGIWGTQIGFGIPALSPCGGGAWDPDFLLLLWRRWLVSRLWILACLLSASVGVVHGWILIGFGSSGIGLCIDFASAGSSLGPCFLGRVWVLSWWFKFGSWIELWVCFRVDVFEIDFGFGSGIQVAWGFGIWVNHIIIGYGTRVFGSCSWEVACYSPSFWHPWLASISRCLDYFFPVFVHCIGIVGWFTMVTITVTSTNFTA
jgi:hypothetical protein